MNDKYTLWGVSFEVGDLITTNSDSRYIGRIVSISFNEDEVKHQDVITNEIFTKSYSGFGVRYRKYGMLKLFLDDIRDPPDSSWIVFRGQNDTASFIHLARHADVISLDHDLGDASWQGMTGYDILKVLENEVYTQGLWSGRGMPEILIHSANPVGRANLEACIASIQRKLSELSSK